MDGLDSFFSQIRRLLHFLAKVKLFVHFLHNLCNPAINSQNRPNIRIWIFNPRSPILLEGHSLSVVIQVLPPN